jgi:nitroreductase
VDAPFDLATTDRLLSTTRAVRKRLDLDRPVDPAVVLECLRLAVQAPTASNDQTWRWMVVTDPDKRRAIGDLYRSVGADYLAQAAESDASGLQTKRVYSSASYLAGVIDQAPIHVIPCITGRYEGAPQGMLAGIYGSIIPAAWSFQLALRSRGLGTAWTTLHLFKEREVGELLGIPEDVTQIALLPVAYTKGTEFKPAVRPPVEDITSWNTWGDHTGF